MHKLRFTLIVLSIFLYGQMSAQLAEPVKWNFSQKKVSEDEVLLIFNANVEPKWHLYTQFFEDGGPMKLSFTFKDSKNYKRIGRVTESPKPKKVMDEVFDIEVQYLEGKGTFTQKIKILSEKDFVINGELEGQACNDVDGSCVPFYPEFEFKIKGVAKKVETGQANETVQDTSKLEIVAEADSLDKDNSLNVMALSTPDTIKTITPVTNASSKVDLGDGSLWLLFWISFLAGLLAILTPCVFPMIPMTVSFFMKSGENKIKGRFQAVFYGISIILIYTVVGTLIAVLFGVNFANWLSTHWLPNVIFFLIFMLFAASFLGMFEITMPSWIVNKSDSQVDKGGFWAPFFMAFTLVVVSFSCTGPLVGAILVKSAGGAVLEPIVGMLGFSLAFALPFTIFAFFPSWLSNLPKSGGWLNSVKVVLGFIEIGLGLKFLSVADQTYHWGILDREIYIAVWIVLAILMGMYFLGKLKFSHDSDLPFISVPRLGMAIVTFSFAVYLIPGMFGAPLKALSGYLPPMSSHDFDISQIVRNNQYGGTAAEEKLPEKPKYADFLHLPHGLNGYFDYEQGLRVAKQLNKPLFIDFTGHGCVNCREMEANVWSDPRVLNMLKNDYLVVALYVDDKTKLSESEWVADKNGKMMKTLGRKNFAFEVDRFEVSAQPYYLLLDTKGELMVSPRAYNLNVEEFVEFLENGLKAFKERQ